MRISGAAYVLYDEGAAPGGGRSGGGGGWGAQRPGSARPAHRRPPHPPIPLYVAFGVFGNILPGNIGFSVQAP
jgi:hypothetical protein